MSKRSGEPRRKAPKKTSETRDVALVVDRTEDKQGFQVLRQRGEDAPIELGTIRPLREGKPIDGEVVSLTPRKEAPFAFDVKTELPPPEKRATSDGPAQVATPAYRAGWEAIWGRGGDGDAAKLN